MDLGSFGARSPGVLVDIVGSDVRLGEWRHKAFLPDRLPSESPILSGQTYRDVANARAALAALDSTARHLPNPRLLRHPTLRREAQSTSALEGTYEPLRAVLTADQEDPASESMREVLNFVSAAESAFRYVDGGRSISLGLLSELQGRLMVGTPGEERGSGSIRSTQVVIGQRRSAGHNQLPVKAARFVPSPPGPDLEARVQDLVTWLNEDHQAIDPVVAAAMGHYQFETLHPFHHGNGRLGRLLIVLQLLRAEVLSEPTLTVSPWFEARREEYYDRLLAVSTAGEWDSWVSFFSRGLAASAKQTQQQLLALSEARQQLLERVRQSPLRAQSASDLVDYAVAHPTFAVRRASDDLNLSYGRVNKLVGQLVKLGILDSLGETYDRLFFAPAVLDVLLTEPDS